MALTVKIIALLYSTLLFGMFIIMARKKGIKPFYSTLWLTVSLFMFSFVIFENLYKKLALVLNIESATLFVIVGLISFLLIYVLHLSIKVSEMSNRIQELISHASILENEVRKLREEKN